MRVLMMSYEVIWEREEFKIITTGLFGNGFLEASVKATIDSRFINAKYAIVYFNSVTDFPIDTNTIRKIAHSDIRAYKVNPNMKLAVVANKIVMIGISNMYKTYFELNNLDKSCEMKVFESENQAREWINA